MKKTLLLISLFLSSQILLAQGRIYWSNLWSSSIGSANLDGSDVKNTFITGLSQPRGIAVDNTNQKIYWVNGSASSIGVANLDGTGVNKNFITGLSSPDDIVLDVANQKIYWTNNLAIGRANLDGTGVDQSFITGIPKYASALALDLVGQKLYWTYYAGVVPTPTTGIGKANLDGTGIIHNFVTGIGGSPASLALDLKNQQIYWVNFYESNTDGSSIGKVNMDGTGLNNNYIAGLAYSGGLFLDLNNQNLFYTNYSSPYGITKANLDGSSADQSFITSIGNGPLDLAINETHAYDVIAPSTPQAPTNVSLSPSQGCVGASVAFSGAMICKTGEAKVWYDANDNVITLPLTTPANETTYKAACKNLYTSQISSSVPVTYTVVSAPTATASASPTTIGSGTSTTLSLTSNTAVSTYSWKGSNGFSSALASPTPTLSSAVQATVSFTVSITATTGCTSTASVEVTVLPLPLAPTNVSLSPSQLCTGNTAAFSGSMTCQNGETKVWYDANDNVITLPLTTPAGTTTYKAACKNNSNNQIGPKQVVVFTVNPLPTLTAQASPNVICSGSSTDLSVLSSASLSGYLWVGSNGFSSNEASPSVTLTSGTPKQFSFSVSVTDMNGCTAMSVVTASVSMGVIASASLPTCAGGTLQLYPSTAGVGAHKWAGPSGYATNLASPKIKNMTSERAGVYTVSVTYNNCIVTATVNVTVPQPASTPALSNSSVCVGSAIKLTASGGGASYLWKGPKGFSSSQSNPIINNATTTQKGIYSLTITNNDGCFSTGTVFVEVKQCAGTRLAAEDFVETIELQAFPNPTARPLHIRITLPQASAVQVQLSDMMGKSVGDWKLSDETTTHEIEIDLGNYQQGMYLLRVESGGKFATKKILKAE